jgi:hypothetical protein
MVLQSNVFPHINTEAFGLIRILSFIDELVRCSYRNRLCLSDKLAVERKKIIQSTYLSVLDYGDIIYQSEAATNFKPLGAIYHSALRFVTGESFDTHHCILYQKFGWTSLTTLRSLHYSLSVYMALQLHKCTPYLNVLLSPRSNVPTSSG